MTTMRRKIGFISIAALGCAAIGVDSAQAVQVLQLDVNSITAQAQDAGGANVAFGGTTHTGSLEMGVDGNAELNDILLNGTSIGPAAGWSLSDYDGTIDLNNGMVTGGSFTVEVSDGVSTDTYMADIVSGSGMVTTGATGFAIDGLTFNGFFSGSTFAGVDVSDWFTEQPLQGSFLEFAFNPDAAGLDNDANVDIFVPVPLPTPAAMGAAGLIGLAGLRRRRTA